MPIKKLLPKPTPKPVAPAPKAKKKIAPKKKGADDHWLTFDTAPPFAPIYSICGHDDPNNRFLLGAGEGFIVKWFVNGLNQWRRQVTGDDMLTTLYGICHVEGDIFVAVGDEILRSTDAGNIWTKSPYDGDTLYRVECYDGKLWAVGDSATVICSDDQGESWRIIATPAKDRLVSVYACEGLIVIGAYNGTVCASYDVGATWELFKRKPATAINRFWGDATKLYAVTNEGYFLTSTSQGEEWDSSIQPCNVDFDVEGGCLGDGVFYLVGQDDSILVQQNGTWKKIEHETSFWDAFYMDGAAYLSSCDGRVFQQRGETSIELKENDPYEVD